MRKLFTLIAAAIAIAGCTTPELTENSVPKTILKTPELVEGKYTLQAFYASMPDEDYKQWEPWFSTAFPASLTMSNGYVITHEEVNKLFRNPNVSIAEFPLVRASIGESATNDQTETYEAVVDAKFVNGETVYTKEQFDLGGSANLTIKRIQEGGSVSGVIKLMHRKLVATEHYKTDEGLEIEIPYFETREVNTPLTLTPGTWILMNGLFSSSNKDLSMNELIFARLLPPK